MDCVNTVLQDAMQMFVPAKIIQRQTSKRYKRRYPNCIRKALARKRCLWRKHRQDPQNQRVYDAYRSMHKECRDLIADYEIKAEKRVINSNDVGAFYRFVKKISVQNRNRNP